MGIAPPHAARGRAPQRDRRVASARADAYALERRWVVHQDPRRSTNISLSQLASCSFVDSLSPSRAIVADQRVGRAVVPQIHLARAGKLGDDPVCQHLAQLNAPLIERID